MKAGDSVVFTDSSYSLTVVGNRLEHHTGELQRERWTVIATNCDLPADTDKLSFSLGQRNNAIVRGQESQKIVFTQERFFRLPVREVTMSEVCKQFGEEVKIKK